MMMEKRWIRLIRNNKVNSIGIFIIILLTVLLGTLFWETNQNLNDSIESIQAGNIQDFSYYPSVTDEELEAAGYDYSEAVNRKNGILAEKYQFGWEERSSKIVKADKNIYRVYPANREIDQLYLTAGRLPAAGEAVLDYKYAQKHGIKSGDAFQIEDEIFTISGFCVFPDQLYPVVDNTGILYSAETQAMLALAQTDYETIAASQETMYVGKFTAGTSFIDDMQEDSGFYSFTATADNVRIYSAVQSQKNMNAIIMGFSMGVLGCIAVLLVILTITQQIKAEQPHLGVLKALGYTNTEISTKYLGYFIILFISALIGYLLGHWLTPAFYQLQCSKFHIPYGNEQINIGSLIIFCIVPSVAITALTFWISMIKVKRPPLHLIKSIKIKRNGILVKRRNKKVTDRNYLKGVRKIILFSNLLLFVFILFGGFALGVQIQFAYTTYYMTANISESILDGANYQNEVRFSQTIEAGSNEENYYFYTIPGKLERSTGEKTKLYDIVILGTGNKGLLELYDNKGKAINISEEDGLIINQHTALQNHLQIGDEVCLLSNEKEVTVKISNILNNVYGTVIYISQSSALTNGILTEAVYNGMYSTKPIDFDYGTHLSVTSIENIRETLDESTGTNRMMSLMLFLCGLIIGSVVLLLAIFGVISNYKKYIAVMKIYGYSEKECQYTTIDGFRIISTIGFLISIPYTYLLAIIMFGWISTTSDMVYPVTFSIKSVIICFALTMAITEIIIRTTKHKTTNISFREVMEH